MSKHIPNILTITRLLLTVPILILFCWIGDSPKIHLMIFTLVAIAASTDWLDGWWARRFNCISDFGKIHDPLADKWLAVLYIPLVSIGMIHFLPVALLWIREITSTHLRIGATKPMPARLSGKIKVIISFPLLCLLIAGIPVENSYLWVFSYLNGFSYWVGGILLSAVCLWSGIDYYWEVIVKPYVTKRKINKVPA